MHVTNEIGVWANLLSSAIIFLLPSGQRGGSGARQATARAGTEAGRPEISPCCILREQLLGSRLAALHDRLWLHCVLALLVVVAFVLDRVRGLRALRLGRCLICAAAYAIVKGQDAFVRGQAARRQEPRWLYVMGIGLIVVVDFGAWKLGNSCSRTGSVRDSAGALGNRSSCSAHPARRGSSDALRIAARLPSCCSVRCDAADRVLIVVMPPPPTAPIMKSNQEPQDESTHDQTRDRQRFRGREFGLLSWFVPDLESETLEDGTVTHPPQEVQKNVSWSSCGAAGGLKYRMV